MSNKRVSDMSDDEIREMAGAAPSPAAWIAAARDRNEHWITHMALTEASVADSPFGDLRKALAALEAVRKIAAGWKAGAPDVAMLDRDVAAAVIEQAITRELLSKEGTSA